jgi:hypothetical protein
MSAIEFPEMRHEVIAAIRSLSDPRHQKLRGGGQLVGINYSDALTLNLHVLYDVCRVLPSAEDAVPAVLHDSEVQVFRPLDTALNPMIADLGERPDADCLADPRWESVVATARSALAVMEAADR